MEEQKAIQTVKDNYEKQNTYRVLKGRYNKAVREGFFFEALIIVYALMEDRLRSFIYYIGGINKHTSTKMDTGKKIKTNLRNIYYGSAEEADGKSLSLNVISNKVKLIEKVVEWVIETEGVPEDFYLQILKKELEGIDLDGMQQILEGIQSWLVFRNEIMHALMNKDADAVYTQLYGKVEEGMKYVDFLDGQVKALRRSKAIRKKMKLGTEYK